MNSLFRPLGIVFVVLGAAALAGGLAAPDSVRGGWILALTLIPVGVVFLLMHGFMKALPKMKLGDSMRQVSQTADYAASYMRGLAGAPARRADLEARGRRGTATVVAVRQTGLEINFTPMADVDLLVEVGGHPAYPVAVRVSLHEVAGLGLAVGARVSVLVDPERPLDVLVADRAGPVVSPGGS